MAAPSHADVVQVLIEVFEESMPDREVPATDAPLFGRDGVLDSMDLVNFVVEVEEVVNERWDGEIVVADQNALSRSKSPFRSLDALAAFCLEQLEAGQ